LTVSGRWSIGGQLVDGPLDFPLDQSEQRVDEVLAS
jgi:hypothetical protein